ncbi:MAG: DNA gyrase subunit A [Alphaproteobacteria bacterium]|nr:MAG: DNA gyrase subunit A [Alphaproteobacteria bacterium]
MKRSYLDYAMSVIVSRALPDVRDGLKPVHRRILYSMHENGYDHTKPYRKSARVVGDVMGKYHPHGDQAIYDALVRLAQDFSMRLPLLDGQGNFGSMDGDKAAAMRYTEVRMDESAQGLLADIDEDTVEFHPNYDESEHEPEVLPARFPNLLVNGAGGIAVGMATNVPPHNLGEVIDACKAYLDNPAITAEELIQYVPAPDFPTGGLILGSGGARSAYMTGRGSVLMRGRTHIEEVRKDRNAIVITEIPYQVNKAGMIEKIAEAVRAKRIEGIADLRDESDRDGVRVVVELKREAVPDVVLNQLYRFTPLQTSFGCNMLALRGGKPELLNLRDIIEAFVRFREEVITRRTKFRLGKARDRAHILVGLVVAVSHIDEVVAIIRGAANPQEARDTLLAREWEAADIEGYLTLINDPRGEYKGGKYRLSQEQVKAILDLRLHRLTALGREEIGGELKELATRIEGFLEILQSRTRLYEVMREEFDDIRDRFATPRRTEVIEADFGDIDDEDLIQREDMVVTVSHAGYIKRVPLSTYRAQRRGGKGRAGMSTRDEDFVSQVFVASTHTPVLFFTNIGKVYKLKVWKLPVGTPQARGKALINLLPLQQGEFATTIMPLPEDEDSWGDLDVMFATASGGVRRNALSDFTNIMSNGKIAMKLDDGDRLIGVAVCNADDDDVLLAARGGKSIRFRANEVRRFAGRTSTGVRGMKLAKGDEVVTMSILRHVELTTEERDAYLRIASARRRGEDATMADGLSEARFQELAEAEQLLLAITENGFGKRTSAYEYRVTGRGGQGIINIETSARNGAVISTFPVEDADHIMMVTDRGRLIRVPVHDIRVAGRQTQGVTLFRVDQGERVVSVARMAEAENDGEDEDQAPAEGGETDGG